MSSIKKGFDVKFKKIQKNSKKFKKIQKNSKKFEIILKYFLLTYI